MLWSKDSDKNDSKYIDLSLDSMYGRSQISVCASRKNNRHSLSARTTGNSKLKSNDYDGAIKMYNESIRYAEDDGFLSLAYANRAYCFMKLELFDQCLTDIQHAIDHRYPENLSQKLLSRKKICMDQLPKQKPANYPMPQLSYDPNLNLPCVANVLEIEVNERYGRLVKAGCNINIGETLLIEEAYVRATTENECYNCTAKKSNFIPCPNCADVMFCCEKCAQNESHMVECNVHFHSDETHGLKSTSFVLRSVMTGISIFGSIKEMMKFIDICLSTDPKEVCSSLTTPESRYRSFFKLSCFGNIGDVRDQASSIFHGMMSSKNLAMRFDNLVKKRFLTHLICHHALIVRSNAFGGPCNPPDEVSDTSVLPIESDFERNIFIATSYINHSCVPNVTKLTKDNLAVVKAIQPISNGQQLFITYLGGELNERTSGDRNEELANSYGFRCQCDLCTIVVRVDARILEMDTDFLFVVKNIEEFQSLISQIKECCVRFISNHSDKLATVPGYFILKTLTAMFQKELES